MDYTIIEKPAFEVIGKGKIFTQDNFFKEAPKFWKEYVSTDEYQKLWNLSNGKWGQVSQTPLMSVYLPNDKGDKQWCPQRNLFMTNGSPPRAMSAIPINPILQHIFQ